jgi:very-short-patch-repair endonuclease
MTRSDLEAFFRGLCAEHDVARPRVNAIVEGEEVDFFWPGAGLIVETDGRETHLTRAAFQRDRAKDAGLTLAGYRVVRFTHRQIEHQRAATGATVVALLRGAGAPPLRHARHSVSASDLTTSVTPSRAVLRPRERQ